MDRNGPFWKYIDSKHDLYKIQIINIKSYKELKRNTDHDEKMELYERMLREKDEMMVRLERLIGK